VGGDVAVGTWCGARCRGWGCGLSRPWLAGDLTVLVDFCAFPSPGVGHELAVALSPFGRNCVGLKTDGLVVEQPSKQWRVDFSAYLPTEFDPFAQLLGDFSLVEASVPKIWPAVRTACRPGAVGGVVSTVSWSRPEPVVFVRE